jgi:hypothetical protein
MTSKYKLTLVILITLFWANHAIAQLNDVKIGQCYDTSQINSWIAGEEKHGLVMDSRPFAINQSTGKLLFTGGTGRVSVVHMNPFVYNYRISVAQQELVSTAISDFVKLLLPQSLATLPGLQSGEAGKREARTAPAKLRLIEARLNNFSLAACNAAAPPAPEGAAAADATAATARREALDACNATAEMWRVFKELESSLAPRAAVSPAVISPMIAILDASQIENRAGARLGPMDTIYVGYVDAVSDLRNEQLDASSTCNKAQAINATLSTYDFNRYFSELNTAQDEISRLSALADDLEKLATEYGNDVKLKDKIQRCNGFSCAGQFLQYAQAVKDVLSDTGGYGAKLRDLRAKGQEMQTMFTLTEQMKVKTGLFARTFEIPKKYELSQATVSVRREAIRKEEAKTATTQSGSAGTSGSSGPTGASGPGATSSEGTVGGPPFVPNREQTNHASTGGKEGGGGTQSGNATALAADQNEVIQLGRPRTMLSAGLVYSPLRRQTFKPIKGFVPDAQGNPTGNGDANVVGFDENSPRRLFPMLFLNSRLLDYEPASLFFSVGVTAKQDDNLDLEYLIGPSVSLLNDRALFTFGAYGGLTQNLVADVKVGDVIPDAIGDAKLFRKSVTWKPGFSFSYSFSRPKRPNAAAAGGATTPSVADDLKNEIRIGSIPFNFALGLAFTSLEQRTYDEIAGFARDRQGNLTNGQKLTRIVGVTSSSNYRMTPLAMLHSRLTKFGRHDLYFTSGITGRKTDNDFDVEYLLGGSVNVYRRKVFLTFGTFVGKQEVLGGNFFEGAALSRSQTVTTENRYVWKPAISFSYDISRILPRARE